MASCKSRRRNHVDGRDNRSASMEECLPQELLEAILGKLSRETLCTARLVSKTFCAAASANVSCLTLRSPSPAVSLERFPRLGHVTVHHIGNDESLAQLDPHLRAVITHLTVSEGQGYIRKILPELTGMPKLRELDVAVGNEVDGAEVLHALTSLEVIRLAACTPSVATTIMTMTWLTSLVIGLGLRPDEPPNVSWLQHATNLRKLQALEISVSHEALPLIGNLTGLTGLTWLGRREWGMGETFTIAPLSRLCRLKSLHIAPRLSDSDVAIACSLGSGCLAKLHLWVRPGTSADCGRLLARQTALTELGVGHAQLCTLRHLGAPRMDLLQSLELMWLRSADAEAFLALQKATSLTYLRISTFTTLPHMGLSQALARLTQLRCLQLGLRYSQADVKILDSSLALSPLTALTKLQISTGRLDTGDLRALLGLTGLHMLHLRGWGLTADVVSELAVLTNLSTLRLYFSGVTSLAPATNILNPLRQARGWPPVDACCV